jgi:alpha-tubulin suppressor-like RCC1 family protein
MTTLRTSAAHVQRGRPRRRTAYRWLIAVVGAAALATGIVVVAQPAAASASTWNAVSAGADHTCGIKTDTTVWCWGANNVGQLGDGTFDNRNTPGPILDGGVGWTSISAGYDFTCGVRGTTRLCWGANGVGQLGLGDTLDRNVPTSRSESIFRWTKVDVGQRHACGLFNAGGIACWGLNTFGQLGTGNTTTRLTPGPLSGGGFWKQVSAGGEHTCAIKSNNLRYCWGVDDAHQLGMVSAGTDPQLTPFHDAADGAYNYLDSGDGTTCVVVGSPNRWLECYGMNVYGNIGNGNTEPTDDTVNFGTWQKVSSGGFHACGIDDNGTLYCWGRNDAGQLGHGDYIDRTWVTQQPVWAPYSSVSAGLHHTCAIRTDLTLYCWGYNAQGQLGTAGFTNQNEPRLVS